MLVQFSVSNFLSFKEKQSISFEVSGIKGPSEGIFRWTSQELSTELLKSISVYGSNASGKSNFLKAFAFMKQWALSSFSLSNRVLEIPVSPYLLSEGYNLKPSSFELIFYIEKIKYRYGFSLTKENIDEEWLFYSEPKKREQHFFVRKEQGISYNNAWRKSTNIDPIVTYVKPKVLFVSVLSQFNIPVGLNIIKWFNQNIVGFDYNSEYHINKTASLLKDSEYYIAIHELIKQAKLGFDSVEEKAIGKYRQSEKYEDDFLEFALTENIDEYLILTKHNVYDKEKKIIKSVMFDLKKNESEGTKKFFALAGAIFTAIKNKQILWVDELDSKFHPILFETIVRFFNSQKFNHLGAQLIFTTHNTQLLKEKVLRRDQIYTVSKDEFGESKITAMHSTSVRIDASQEKEYFSGNAGELQKINLENVQLDLFGNPK